MNLDKGDKVLRLLPPSEVWYAWVNEGYVIDIDKTTITCTILVDYPRTMKFNRNTGVGEVGDFIIKRPE